MSKNVLLSLALISAIFFIQSCTITDKPKTVAEDPDMAGYLLAHMSTEDYGSLFYSISRDGKQWELLNKGERIESGYQGHPDICKGGDGHFYMIGLESPSDSLILWRSKDLVTWIKKKHLPKSAFLDNNPGFVTNQYWFGAPKMYYDEVSKQYIITWHASGVGMEGEERWKSMRTFYILSSDFETFTPPVRLFDFDNPNDREMATIDVIIRKVGRIYYAIIKDERWPKDIHTGKTIRIASSENLTGPYSNPGPPITPSWYEAPSIVPKSDNSGWFLYAESYPNKYMLFETDSINGSWTPVQVNLEGARHGCVIQIDEKQYNRLLSAYSFQNN